MRSNKSRQRTDKKAMLFDGPRNAYVERQLSSKLNGSNGSIGTCQALGGNGGAECCLPRTRDKHASAGSSHLQTGDTMKPWQREAMCGN